MQRSFKFNVNQRRQGLARLHISISAMPYHPYDYDAYDYPGGHHDHDRFTHQHSGRVPPLRHLAEDAIHTAEDPPPIIKPKATGRETPITKLKKTTSRQSKMPSIGPKATIHKQAIAKKISLQQLMDIDDPMKSHLLTAKAKAQGDIP
jgi:hypothetical protein